jgi:hypothetical protein
VPWIRVKTISSGMVEWCSATPNGLSASVIAARELTENNRRLMKVQLTTPRDDLIIPGMTIAVASPTRLSMNGNMWVQAVDVKYASGFSQTFTCIATAA